MFQETETNEYLPSVLYNEKRMQTPLSVHSWVRFFSSFWCVPVRACVCVSVRLCVCLRAPVFFGAIYVQNGDFHETM